MSHGTLDPGYISDLAPCLAGHTTRRTRVRRAEEEETSSWTLRLTVRAPGEVVYWRETIPRGVTRRTAEEAARRKIAQRGDRMRLLALSTPRMPAPKQVLIARYTRGIATLQELQAMADATWHRQYTCQIPATGSIS